MLLHLLFFLELPCKLLVAFFDQLFCQNHLALFAGDIYNILHGCAAYKFSDVVRLCQIDTAAGFLSVLCSVDNAPVDCVDEKNLHGNPPKHGVAL